MTQTEHGVVGHSLPEPRWREAARWAGAKRVTIGALVIAGVQAGLDSYVLSRGFFQQDDFAIGGLTAHAFTFHMLFQNYAGHLMPGVFATAWTLTHVGAPYDWGLWDGLLVAAQGLATLALLRALRTMFGDRMAILAPLGLFALTPLTMTDLSFWAAGVQAAPLALALALALDQHVRYIRDRRVVNAVLATAAILLGCAFDEKAIGIPPLLLAVTAGFLVPVPSWPAAAAATLRRHWPAWVLYGSALGGELSVYILSRLAVPGPLRVPHAADSLKFGWGLLRGTFLPAAAGGPWRWSPAGVPAWSLNSLAAPPAALLYLSWAVAALAVLLSLWYRDGAWRAWVILLCWLLLIDIAPVVSGLFSGLASLIAGQTTDVADAAPVLAVCVALAFLRLRDERGAYRATMPGGATRYVAAASATAVAAAVAAGAVASDGAYRAQLSPASTRSYLATAATALTSLPAGAVLLPGQLPAPIAYPLTGQALESALAPLITQVGVEFRWDARPAGVPPGFYLFNQVGQLQPVTIAGPHTLPFARQNQCVPGAAGLRLPFTSEVFPGPFLLQLGYYSSVPVTLTVGFGGQQYQLTVPASRLAEAYLPVQGPDSAVQIVPASPGAHICIGTVSVGRAVADTTAVPIPQTPVRG